MESDDEYQDEIQVSFLFDESFVGLHLNRTPLFSSSDANAEVKMSSAVACTTKNDRPLHVLPDIAPLRFFPTPVDIISPYYTTYGGDDGKEQTMVRFVV